MMSRKRKAEAREALLKVAAGLTTAPRMGADKDEPEGSRYIQVSDTLAEIWAAELARAAEKLA